MNSVAEFLWYSYQVLTSEQTLHHSFKPMSFNSKEISHRGLFSWFGTLIEFSLQSTEKLNLFQAALTISSSEYQSLAGVATPEDCFSKGDHKMTFLLQQKYVLVDTFLCVSCSKKYDAKYYVNIKRFIEAKFCVQILPLSKCCQYLCVQINRKSSILSKKKQNFGKSPASSVTL